MIRQILLWLNLCLIGLIGLVLAGLLWWRSPIPLSFVTPELRTVKVPKNAFEHPTFDYDAIDRHFITLRHSPPSLQLPDLKSVIQYLGKNGRPDARSGLGNLHFTLAGSKSVVSVSPNEKLYLVLDKALQPPRYLLSPKNEKTSLWVEVTPTDNSIVVNVGMVDDHDRLIKDPPSHAQFSLPDKEASRAGSANWEIGSLKVDGTLLARQRAKWFGPDKFLDNHGGEEFEELKGKHRIYFGEGDEMYSIFVGPGDCFNFENNRWKSIQPGPESTVHPLLSVKKIDDRLISFELWDVEGKGKVGLNLLKSTEPWVGVNAQVIQSMFKFVAARTRSQFVFKVKGERMVIAPHDWLLLTAKGWMKLVSEKDIDAYVNRQVMGSLLVLRGITRKGDQQVLNGILYNPSRSDSQEIALLVGQGKDSKRSQPNKNDKVDPDDDDDDDDDFDVPDMPIKSKGPDAAVPNTPPNMYNIENRHPPKGVQK